MEDTLFVTDLDGTLLTSKGQLSDETKKSLNNLIDKGVSLTLATARTFATVNEMFKDVKLNVPVILMNGVMIYDTIKKHVIDSQEIDKDFAVKVLEIYSKYGKAPMFYYDKGDRIEIEYSDLGNEHQLSYVNNRTDVTGKSFHYSPVPYIREKDKLIYIVTLDKYENLFPVYQETKAIDGITAAFYSDNYTGCYFLEIFAKTASKALSVTKVKKLTGKTKIVAFGDNLNDISMFEIADKAYAVSNACDELKDIATDVILSNDENAVTKQIEKLLTAKEE